MSGKPASHRLPSPQSESRVSAAMEEEHLGAAAVVGKKFCSEEERELTVRKTSLFFPGDGFAAYDHKTGELIFRVDTYARREPSFSDHHLLLMDPDGHPILTLRRKWPSLHQRWEAFVGERSEGQKPLFAVRRSSIFGRDRSCFAVEVHQSGGSEEEYRIEGSFAQRCCRVLYEGGGGEEAVILAEIKRKVDACSQVVLGRDVFSLCLRPRCDAAFAMALVIVLDKITGDNDDVILEEQVSSSAEDPSPIIDQQKPADH
ncbi:hypothetical protein Cni_G23838 [Canna indica]|uniref:Protein LURP-one-related 5-like n=1 Tax=Canna indica TaxID=4628 RepID=A0AAQ3KTU1_9LILI|nr:hypothetical protein Cni_G23838 [Canna indica]